MTYQADSDLEVDVVNTSWHNAHGDLKLLIERQFILLSTSEFLKGYLIQLQMWFFWVPE